MGLNSPIGSGSALYLPQPLDDEVQRGRLIAMLEQRWSHRVTLLEAPGGYGKTRALRQAIADNATDPVGIDIYVPILRWFDAAELGRAVNDAVAGDLGESRCKPTVPQATPAGVAAMVAKQVPTRICIVLDDVHHLVGESAAVKWLDDLVQALPNNATVVLGGRRMPELRLARLEADSQVARVGSVDLAFTPDELAELTGGNVAPLGDLGAWPAFARLTLKVGRAGALDFLLQEVVDAISVAQRRALAVLCVVETADADLFAALDIDVDPAELAASLPLVEAAFDGSIQPHDLLVEAADQVVALAELVIDQLFVERVSQWLSTTGRHREAVDAALRLGHPTIALRQMLRLRAEINDATLDVRLLDRWLEAVPARLKATGEFFFLRSLRTRLATGPDAGLDDLERALSAFRSTGNAEGLTAALIELFFCGWHTADLDLIQRSIDEGEPLGLDGLSSSGFVIRRELDGRLHEAHELAKAALGPEANIDQLRWMTSMALVAGDEENCLERADQLVARAPVEASRASRTIVRFLLGDIDEAARRWDELRYRSRGNHRDDFLTNMYSCWIDASLGLQPRSDLVAEHAWARTREQFFVSVTRLFDDVIAARPDADAMFETSIRKIGLDDPLVRWELRRFLAPAAVASSQVFERLTAPDIQPELAPFHQARLDLARLVRAARAGTKIDPAWYSDPGTTISSLPLPWTVEVACALVPADIRQAIALVETLFLYSAAATTSLLRRFAASDDWFSPGAAALLRTLPTPPSSPLVITAQGKLELSRDGMRWAPRRKRVRQLLSLLILWRDGHRDTIAEALWPEMPVDRARQNLSVNLTYLRRELELDRAEGEPHFHLRQVGERLQLFDSEHLAIDIWALQDLATAEVSSTVWQRWRGTVLPDLRDIDAVLPDLHELDEQLAGAVARAGAQALGHGHHSDALEAGFRLLENDRFDERGHRLVMAAHLGLRQTREAQAASAACLRAIEELGVAVSAETRMLMRQIADPRVPLGVAGV